MELIISDNITNKISCFCCDKQYLNHQVISCVICKNSFGGSCVSVENSKIRMINLKKSNVWNCPNWENLGGDVASLKVVIASLQV